MASVSRTSLDAARAAFAELSSPRVAVLSSTNLGEVAPPPPELAPLAAALTRWHPNDLEPTSHPAAVGCLNDALRDGRAETAVRFLRGGAVRRMTAVVVEDLELVLVAFSDDPAELVEPVDATITSATVILDAGGAMLRSGGQLEALLGWPPEHLLHQPLLAAVHPDDRGRTIAAFAASLSEPGMGQHVRTRLRSAAGTWRWVAFHGIGEHEGDLVRVRTTITDIDDEMRALDALDRSERRLRTLAESIPIGVFRADGDGIVRFANAALRRLHPLEVDSSRWTDLVHRIDLPLLRDALLTFGDPSAAEDGDVLDGVFRLAPGPDAPPGPQRTIRILARAVHDQAGALSEVVGSVDDVTERRALEARLEHAATHDSLTGLANRAALSTHLDQRIVHSGADGVTVLFVDLDGFKRINDSLGHSVGDELLSTIARRIREAVRPEDFVVRFGGDEFVIVSDQPRGADGALALAHRVLTAVREPVELRGTLIQARASVGVAIGATSGGDAEALLRDADAAMYAAKAAETGGVRIADGEVRTAATRRLAIEAALARPTEAGHGFRFDYQPIFDLESGEMVGIESLIRWDHPDLGPVRPDELLPVAEDTGAIHTIASWGLDRAARDLPIVRGDHPGLASVRIGINLSDVQLSHPDYVRRHLDIVERTGLTPADLVVEVTETNLIDVSAPAEAALDELHRRGVRIALDDFGAGYSSLEYLTRLPVDYLKLDRGMVARLAVHEPSRKVVRGLVGICDDLGIRVIAEGIETDRDVTCCRDLGVADGQGYLLARPQPLAQLRGWAAIDPRAEALVSGTNVPNRTTSTGRS